MSDKKTGPVQLSFRKLIMSEGDISFVTISKFGVSIELTKEQAKSLVTELGRRLS